MGQIWKIL
jgi:small subunit ribosomal protein S16e